MVISKSVGPAPYTNVAAAASTTSQVAVFLAAAGQPGAGLQLTANLPGTSRFDGKPFRARASMKVSLGAGTYTATVQPLVYASTTNGFTAAAASAIYSAAAVAVAVASPSAVLFDWSGWIDIEGSTSSGSVGGSYGAIYNNGAVGSVALAVIANAPTSVNFASEPPLQFSAGVTLVGGIGGSVATLSQLELVAD